MLEIFQHEKNYLSKEMLNPIQITLDYIYLKHLKKQFIEEK